MERRWGLGIALLLVAAGCSKENALDSGTLVGSGVGAQCSGPNDPGCGSAGVCALGYCRTGCATDAECPQGALCVGDAPPYGCQLEQDRACNDTDKKCKLGLVCGIDATCRMPCSTSTKCPRTEQECIQGTCVAKTEAGSLGTWFSCTTGDVRCGGPDGLTLEQCNGSKPGWATAPAGTPDSCESVGSPCDASGAMCVGTNAACVLGYCRVVCTTDGACPQGGLCIGDKQPYGCQLPQDAACSSSQPCKTPLVCGLDSTCRMACVQSKDCPRSDQDCHAGVCVGDSEKGDAAVAYRSCTDGDLRCGTGEPSCGAVPCEVQGCNMNAPGWATVEQCTGDTAFCSDKKCGGIHPEDPGPLVQVKSPMGGTYGIDATEVTRAQYLKFFSEKQGDASGQLPECSSNTTYMPSGDWPPVDRPQHPIAYVDWCDAYAYCKAVGKRLCGKIGGGANDYLDLADATRSQWFNACTSGGLNDYPYGDAYNAQTCNNSGATVACGSLSTCQSSVGGYTGVYDLSGNLWEWEDSCSGNSGQTDACHARGGSFASAYLTCAPQPGPSFLRTVSYSDVGLRCCWP